MPTPGPTTPLLVETLAGVATAPGGNRRSLVAGSPYGDEWVVLADLLADPTLVDDWFPAGSGGTSTDHGSSTIASVAGDVSRISFEPVVDAVLAQRRAWHLGADTLAVRRNHQGRYDGLAVLSPSVRVLPGDPRADDRDAVVLDDVDELHATVADEAADLLTQVVDALQACGNPGMDVLWGSVAAHLGSMAIWRTAGRVERATEITRRFGWAAATVEVAAAPSRYERAVFAPIEWAGGLSVAAVRGAYCPRDHSADEGRSGVPDDGYCGPCPLLDEESRRLLRVDY